MFADELEVESSYGVRFWTAGQIGQFVLYMVALLLALSAHEAAHAWMSNWFGDDTARLQGRITFNPMAHVDPIGTLLFPVVGFVLAVWVAPVARFR